MSSTLADLYEPKCGGWEGGVAGSQPMSTAIHRSPNKLWRSNSIWFSVLALFKSVKVSGGTQHSLSVVRKNPKVLHILAHIVSIL
jgi:hypothetical protein